MDLPAINTNLNVNSQAHPSPVRSPAEEQRLRAAIARVPIAVHLQNLSFESSVTVPDVLTPKVRRPPFNDDVNPSHLDVVECWKGLSYTQTRELAMWYQFLHESLRNEVREALAKDVVTQLLGSQEVIDDVYLVARMLECLRSKSYRIIDISFVDVIDSMMGMFHDQFPTESASLASHWTHFSGGLSAFLHNFLRLQDCFGSSAHGPYVELKFDFQYADWLLTATGDIMWHSPTIRFLHVPPTRATGELYRITPFVCKEEVDSPTRSPGCDNYVDQVDYTIPRSPLHFHWDPAKVCFVAVVPHFSSVSPHTVETVVKATVTTPFPDHVKFERQSRWSIKLNIMPGKSDFLPDINNDRPSIQRHGSQRLDTTTGPRLPTWTMLMDARSKLLRSSKQATVLRQSLGTAVTPPLSQKRKVSRPEVIDTAASPKRRRRNSGSEIGNELPSPEESTSDDCYEGKTVDEVQHTIERTGEDACIDPAVSLVPRHSVDKCHVMPLHPPVPVWTEHLGQLDSGFSSPATSADSSEESPAPSVAVTTDCEALRQEQILHNYREFAERKRRKDAGLISPVSDGERRAYESIFMGDSDEWSPVTDESTMNLDTIMSER